MSPHNGPAVGRIMDDDSSRIDLSRRKALTAIGSIGVASAGAGLGTSAFFSDRETFENNQLTAGTLDMTVGWAEHYSDWSPDEEAGVTYRMYEGGGIGSASDLADGETGFPANDAWLIAVDDPDRFLANTEQEAVAMAESPCDGLNVPGDLANQGGDRPVVDVEDVKPGDFGLVTFEFALCDNPGYVWLNAQTSGVTDTDTTEPEADDPAEDAATVELLDQALAVLWIDDGTGTMASSGSTTMVDSLRNVLAAMETGSGMALAGDVAASQGGGTGRNCFGGTGGDGVATHSAVFAWAVPTDRTNAMQSDGVTFDLGFYTEQCRRNDGVGLSTDLLAHYPFDGSAADVSGNDYDGTVVGDVSFPAGREGRAATFDGSDDHVEVPPIDLGSAFTVSAWVNLDQDSDWNDVFGAEKRFSMLSYSDGHLAVAVGDGSWDVIGTTSPGTTTPGTWQHWAATYDGSTARLYVDGVETVAEPGTTSVPASTYHVGGRYQNRDKYRFDGAIDDVHVYGRALSAAEVQALSNGG